MHRSGKKSSRLQWKHGAPIHSMKPLGSRAGAMPRRKHRVEPGVDCHVVREQTSGHEAIWWRQAVLGAFPGAR